MTKIHIDHSDGRYFVRELTDAEAAEREKLGLDVAHVEPGLWAEYARHGLTDSIWQALWQSIDNKLHVTRRMDELVPLEQAQWEISRLREELARAERMAKHYEEDSRRTRIAVRGGDHRQREYTCVFPVPGCDVGILPPAWRERARGILTTYRADLAAEGMTVQGCCCGYGEHQRLHDATVTRLRAAGFIVEHDVEVDYDDDEGDA